MFWQRSFTAPRTTTEPAEPALHAEESALAQAARHDSRAFQTLYERYNGPIYRYCFVRLGDREASEDATSEVFTKALVNLGTYQGGRFGAWLFRIAMRVVVDVYRARREASLEAMERPDPGPALEDRIVAQAERAALQSALEALPPDYRAAVELKLAGWSGEQIAEALETTPDAVKTMRYRAMQRMKAWLEKTANG